MKTDTVHDHWNVRWVAQDAKWPRPAPGVTACTATPGPGARIQDPGAGTRTRIRI
ncbi:hypothetical protein ATI53_1005140 [Salipiger aestuarii]|uniref:Uncharacterized protein n=2 Tax=Salipiger aestuarii TaxID=568098 RepID=A0A327YK55_9RHOB|nr:hypothetical protein [Salipiger aestuarii]RAK20891.1 hypothetical protein ATI53_1005140 [Salipiger aestuarii]